MALGELQIQPSPWEREHGLMERSQVNLVNEYVGEPEYQAMIEAMRREGPVSFYEYDGSKGYDGFWVVTDNALGVEVLKHADAFSSHGPVNGGGGIAIHDLPPGILTRDLLVMQDEPRHGQQRGVIERHFRRTSVDRLTDFLRATSRQLVSRVVDAGEVDFVSTIASPIPLAAIAEILSIPDEERDEIYEHGKRIALIDSPNPRITPEDVMAVGKVLEIAKQIRAHVVSGEISNEVLSDLSSAVYRRSQGETPTDDKFITSGQADYFFILLFLAGNETTRNSLSWGTYAMAKNPDQWTLLKEHPELIGDAADEIVRWTTAVRYTRRTVMKDVRLDEVDVKEGEKVVVSLTGANHDPHVFNRPFDFDITRGTELANALSFGRGAHFCLGKHLARLEITVALEELLTQVDHIELAGEPTRNPSTFINNVAKLLVKLIPA